jgi:FkbM family methyltransferase
MNFSFKPIIRFFKNKISEDRSSIWTWLFLFRKIYIIKIFRIFYSQFGEDIVLKGFILRNITDGFYVDVGCYHPKKYSNTYQLHKKGWRGINIDLDRLKIKAFNWARPEDHNVTAAVSDQKSTVKVYNFGHYSLDSTLDEHTAFKNREKIEGVREVETRTLSEIIESSPFAGRQIDLLSIDTEGHDLNVLKSLDFEKYKPRLVIIETHLMNMDQIMESELYKFLKKNGYYLINWVGFTLFFTYPNNDLLLPDIPFRR